MEELNNAFNAIAKAQSAAVDAYILKQLAGLGYHFDRANSPEFIAFAIQRLTLASFDGSDDNEIYLDYGTPNQTLVAFWSEKVNITVNGPTVTATIG